MSTSVVKVENKRGSGQRAKKRKFQGNRYQASNESLPESKKRNFPVSTPETASRKKLENTSLDDAIIDNEFLGYRLIDLTILFNELSSNLCCKTCGGVIEMKETLTNGLASKFSISCTKCDKLSSFYSTKSLNDKRDCPEVNRRFTYAMRCLGQGWAGMNTFCSIMDMPPPLQKTAYTRLLKDIAHDVSRAANSSMTEAAEQEIRETGHAKITVSGDGSWKTRGHSSQIGIVSVIGAETGKVIDIEVMSSFCKGCEKGKKLKPGSEYAAWENEHKNLCLKNHSGSAGKMEVDGMLRIFQHSETKHKAQYLNYIGDGDTKTFLELQKNHSYGPDVKLCKIECVGHVQKRMGSRLRKLKSSMRGKKLSDNKPLSGKGRLTDNLIKEITLFYGIAIRANKSSLMDMRKAIWAIYYHKRSTDDEVLHDFCPIGSTSWCEYQRFKAEGKEGSYHHKNVLPAAVMDCIKPIFKDLSHPDLLRRCLGGRTQNPNESYNSLVWKFCPKTSGCSRIVAEIAANEAVVTFNNGRKGRLTVMSFLGFQVGRYAFDAAKKIDMKRLEEAEKKSTELSLKIRRARHMLNSSKLEELKEQEGVIYEPGNF